MSSWITSGVAIITAIIGVAIISVLLSKKSATDNVISTGGKVFDSIVSDAVNIGGVSGGVSLGGILNPQ